MKVILKADVKGQGKKGDMIEVSEGYGRNFLLPRGLAVAATADNLNLKRQADEAAAHRAAVEKAAAQEYAAKLKTVRVKVSAKGGAGGRLFGAVTAKEVSECLKTQHGMTFLRIRSLWSRSRPSAPPSSRPSCIPKSSRRSP